VALSLGDIKNPFTFTELETLIDGDLDASNFTGPVLIINPHPVLCLGSVGTSTYNEYKY
jgi:hypothetical protein